MLQAQEKWFNTAAVSVREANEASRAKPGQGRVQSERRYEVRLDQAAIAIQEWRRVQSDVRYWTTEHEQSRHLSLGKIAAAANKSGVLTQPPPPSPNGSTTHPYGEGWRMNKYRAGKRKGW